VWWSLGALMIIPYRALHVLRAAFWLIVEIKLCGRSVSNFWKEIERASVGAHCQGEDLLPCYYPTAA